MRKAVMISATILLLGSLLAAIALWPDPVKTAEKATFAVYLGTSFTCTATIFEKIPHGYYLLTAGHCIEDKPEAQYFIAEQIGSPRSEVRVVKYYDDDILDFAILQFLTDKSYPVIPLGQDAETGREVINPNFGYGLAKQLSKGYVSSEPMVRNKECPCEGKFLVQIYGAQGSSGSAVIANGHIVGIVIGEFEGLNVGLTAEPISTFPAFLAAPEMQKHLTFPLHGGILF